VKGKKSSLIACLALAALAEGFGTEASLDCTANTAISDGSFSPFLAFSLGARIDRLAADGSSLFFDFGADASRELLGSGCSGALDFDLSLRRLMGATSLGLELEGSGSLPTASAQGAAALRLSLPLVFNGPDLSLLLRPLAAVDLLETGYVSAGIEGGFSLMAGSLVLKPGLGFSLLRPWDGGLYYSLEPAAELSWYPGFPLSASFLASLRLSAEPLGLEAWSFEGSLVASPARGLLLSLESSAFFSAASSELSLVLEAAPAIDRDGASGWSLPLRLGWTLSSAEPSYSVGLGLRCSIDGD